MVKNIIFDLGGVIIDIDFNLSTEALMRISPQKSLLQKDSFKSDLFLDYEKGNLTDAEFRDAVRTQFEIQATDEEIDAAWNALLGDIPKERIDILIQLKGYFRTFLLSNTNAVHIEGVEEILNQQHQINSLSALFEKTYFSHHIHCRKPDPQAYLHILEENNLKPQETLFLDDNEDNILAAESLGMQVLHIHQNSNEILKLSVLLEDVMKIS